MREDEASEIDQLRARLARAEQLLKNRAELQAMISHDLREPMNGILGMTRLLRRTELSGEQIDYVDAAIAAAEALISLINDIVDLSRIDADALPLLETSFAMRPFLARLVTLLESRARQKGLRFSLRVEQSLPALVIGDPGRLRQVLTNLAGNAIKFTSKGSVTLDVAPAETLGRVRFALTDTGPGFSQTGGGGSTSDDLWRDEWMRRAFGGSGLGLVMTRRLVERMNGTLEFSTSKKGTTALLELPLAPAMRPDLAPDTSTEAIAGLRLLICDANQRVREELAQMVTGWRLSIRTTASGQETIAAIEDAADRQENFDYVIVNATVKDPSPSDLARVLRSDPRLEGIRLMLVTATGLRGDAAKAQRWGYDSYLSEPVRPDTLLAALLELQQHATSDLVTRHSLQERPRKTLEVLVVDDEPVNRKLASIVLKKAGHAVACASDGFEALRMLASRRFDVVLMDVQMPQLDGMEVTRRIRDGHRGDDREVPVIAVTAQATPDDEARCREAGMNGYVTKPLDPDYLLGSIAAATSDRAVSPS